MSKRFTVYDAADHTFGHKSDTEDWRLSEIEEDGSEDDVQYDPEQEDTSDLILV